jgi:hypothetical protein
MPQLALPKIKVFAQLPLFFSIELSILKETNRTLRVQMKKKAIETGIK